MLRLEETHFSLKTKFTIKMPWQRENVERVKKGEYPYYRTSTKR